MFDILSCGRVKTTPEFGAFNFQSSNFSVLCFLSSANSFVETLAAGYSRLPYADVYLSICVYLSSSSLRNWNRSCGFLPLLFVSKWISSGFIKN